MGTVLVYAGGSWKGPSHLVGIYQVMVAGAFPRREKGMCKGPELSLWLGTTIYPGRDHEGGVITLISQRHQPSFWKIKTQGPKAPTLQSRNPKSQIFLISKAILSLMGNISFCLWKAFKANTHIRHNWFSFSLDTHKNVSEETIKALLSPSSKSG